MAEKKKTNMLTFEHTNSVVLMWLQGMSQNTHARYKESFRWFTANEIHSNNIHSYVTVTVKIAEVQTGKSRWRDFLRHVWRRSVAWAQVSVVEMFRSATEEVAVTTEREVLNTVWTQLQRTFQRLEWWRRGHQKIDWLSMVLRLHQHNIGYTADGFYRSKDPTNSVKAMKEGG